MIEANNEAGVKSFEVETFCEEDSKDYHVILQNG